MTRLSGWVSWYTLYDMIPPILPDTRVDVLYDDETIVNGNAKGFNWWSADPNAPRRIIAYRFRWL